MTRLPWDAWFRFAILILGTPPHRAWRLTPRELALAHRAMSAPFERLARNDIADLMKAYPDQPATE